MDAIGDHAPNEKIGGVGDLYGLIEGVFWNKVKRTIPLRKPFHRKFPVQVGNQ